MGDRAIRQVFQPQDAHDPQPVLDNQHAGHQASQQNSQPAEWWVYACSHGGDVVAVDGASGEPVWETRLPARLNAGMTLSKDCSVSPAHLKNGMHLERHSPGESCLFFDFKTTFKTCMQRQSCQGASTRLVIEELLWACLFLEAADSNCCPAHAALSWELL